jgi:hypothetical protein
LRADGAARPRLDTPYICRWHGFQRRALSHHFVGDVRTDGVLAGGSEMVPYEGSDRRPIADLSWVSRSLDEPLETVVE